MSDYLLQENGSRLWLEDDTGYLLLGGFPFGNVEASDAGRFGVSATDAERFGASVSDVGIGDAAVSE